MSQPVVIKGNKHGIKLGRKLKEKFPDVKLVYITSYEEYRDNLPEMTLESIYKKAENDFQTAKKSELLTKNLIKKYEVKRDDRES